MQGNEKSKKQTKSLESPRAEVNHPTQDNFEANSHSGGDKS